MPRAYFSPLGIGYGHASRSLNLARRLKKEGFSIFFSAYGDAASYLKNARDVEVVQCGEEMVWKQKPDGSPDLWGTLKSLSELRKFLHHIKTEKENIEAVSPDVVVSDSRISTLIAAQYLGVPSVVVLNQPKLLLSPLMRRDSPPDDLSESEGYSVLSTVLEKLLNMAMTRFWGLSQASIIADFPPPFSISKYHTSDLPKPLMDRIVFSGPLIEPDCEPDREEDVILIMISGPGAERKSLADVILDLLNDIPRDLKEYEFIVSLGEPSNSGSEEVRGNVRIYNWLPDKWSFLERAKLVVSRAGHTTIAEALMCGKPLLLIPVPGQTEKMENARSIEEMGLGRMIRQSEVRERFFEVMRSLLEGDYGERVRGFRERFKDWNFLDRAAGIIESVLY